MGHDHHLLEGLEMSEWRSADNEECFRIYGDTQEVGGSSSCKSSSSTSLPASPLLPFLREKEKQREKWIIIFLNDPYFDPVVDLEKPDFWLTIVYKVWSTIQITQAKNRPHNHRRFGIKKINKKKINNIKLIDRGCKINIFISFRESMIPQ